MEMDTQRKSHTEDDMTTYEAKDQQWKFDPVAYLSSFYSTANDDSAMQMILFFLPGLVYRIPEGGSLLDVGSGPTVHVAFVFRNRVDQIYLSDFAEQNRRELLKWWHNDPGCYEWKEIIKWLTLLEAPTKPPPPMELVARQKIQAILACDVHNERVILDSGRQPENVSVPEQFDVVTSVFCLEYASSSFAEYLSAVVNVGKLVKSGGFLMLGGVFEEKSYSFGGCRFRCHYLKKREVFSALSEAGFATDDGKFKLMENDGVFMALARKK